MRKFDSKTAREISSQLRAASVAHRVPTVPQNVMRWWNVAGVLLHLLNKVEEQERRISELEKLNV